MTSKFSIVRKPDLYQGSTLVADQKRPYEIQLINHAFHIIELFEGENVEFGLTDLSLRMNLNKNKAFRILATLKDLNYLEQNRNGNYRLGFKAFKMLQPVGRQMWWRDKGRDIMETMAIESSETVCFSVLRNFDTVTLEAVEGNQILRVIPSIGTPYPSYCCAAGKVLIANMGENKLQKYLSTGTFTPLTSFTATDLTQLREQLKQVAQQGYALEDKEMDVEVMGLAAPIRDYSSAVVGTISLSSPAYRHGEERLKTLLIPTLLKGAAQLSARLGYFSADESAESRAAKTGVKAGRRS
jgi:DNA-binding IclR family transcriptional regulator